MGIFYCQSAKGAGLALLLAFTPHRVCNMPKQPVKWTIYSVQLIQHSLCNRPFSRTSNPLKKVLVLIVEKFQLQKGPLRIHSGNFTYFYSRQDYYYYYFIPYYIKLPMCVLCSDFICSTISSVTRQRKTMKFCISTQNKLIQALA